MVLRILRAAFILLFVSVTLLYVLHYQRAALARGLENQDETSMGLGKVLAMVGIAMALALAVIAVDAFTKRKKLSAISGLFLGLVAGLVTAYALGFVVELIGLLFAPLDPAERVAYLDLLKGVKILIGLITCYLGISLVMQTKDDFRFVIPYVEFAKKIRGTRPTVLDTSIIVDGRILDIIDTRAIQGVLVVPKFVLNELQTIADSADKLRRARGRRGLEVLQKIQDNAFVEVHLDDSDVDGATVDQKLIALTQHLGGRVMTSDFNLNKVASLRGVDVINLNDLAKALRPVVLPGEHMRVALVKPGEAATQGVGYLDDGTMVVVEQGRSRIGEEIELVVTSSLQTSAGRMIFGRYEDTPGPDVRGQEPAALPAGDGGAAGDAASPGRPPRKILSGRNPRRAH